MGIISTAAKMLWKGGNITVDELLEAIEKIEDAGIAGLPHTPSPSPKTSDNKSVEVVERKGSLRGRKERGTRCPADFAMTDEMLDWACLQEGWTAADARRETENFVDHWQSDATQRAFKCDWVRTWKKWMRTSRDYRNGRQAQAPGLQRPIGRRTVADAARERLQELMRRDQGDGGSARPNGAIRRLREG